MERQIACVAAEVLCWSWIRSLSWEMRARCDGIWKAFQAPYLRSEGRSRPLRSFDCLGRSRRLPSSKVMKRQLKGFARCPSRPVSPPSMPAAEKGSMRRAGLVVGPPCLPMHDATSLMSERARCLVLSCCCGTRRRRLNQQIGSRWEQAAPHNVSLT